MKILKKIFNINILSKIIEEKKLKNKRVVLCHGVFDILHLGHIEHFRSAKALGDILVVTVTSDNYVKKGPYRPFFSIEERMKTLEAIEYIDYIAQSNFKNANQVIEKIKPNIYCKGKDYKQTKDDFTRQITKEINVVKKNGGKVVFTDNRLYSSSKIINTRMNNLSEIQNNFLKKIKSNFQFNKIEKIINKLKSLKILVVGEIILDQYNFCKAIGKSGKEPVLTFHKTNIEKYLGGAGAIANHLANFSDNVDLYSYIGEKSSQLKFIKKELNKKIKLSYIVKDNSQTIVKEKYIQSNDNRKVFSSYSFNDTSMSKKKNEEFNKYLNKFIKKYDLIIISDYAHGLISSQIAKIIYKKSNFLSINCQINSSNINSHTLKKYKNYELLVINESELRHEFRDNFSNIKLLIKKISVDLKILNIIVTQGSLGAILYSSKERKFYTCPAFASKIVDKVGAGDAMLALSSICLKLNIDKNLLLLIGSLASSQVVETIGNSKSVNKMDLLKSINYLLK
jgi:rfaE bifunctional protein kinase chain/domain/rfaE bifunctional protein nucleotidyltransferase chain/domain